MGTRLEPCPSFRAAFLRSESTLCPGLPPSRDILRTLRPAPMARASPNCRQTSGFGVASVWWRVLGHRLVDFFAALVLASASFWRFSSSSCSEPRSSMKAFSAPSPFWKPVRTMRR
jgi:hypothetical protein